MENTVWATPRNTGGEGSPLLQKEDMGELASLFAKPKPGAKKKIDRKGPLSKARRGKKSLGAGLVNMKRANNVAICLSQFKSFKNYDEVADALRSLDYKAFTVER